VSSLGERYVSADIEEHADYAQRGAKVLAHIDERLLANSRSIVRSPASPCMFDSVSFGGKVLRRRGAWRWELASVVARIGPASSLPRYVLYSRCRPKPATSHYRMLTFERRSTSLASSLCQASSGALTVPWLAFCGGL
jgi:hypothetical protein